MILNSINTSSFNTAIVSINIILFLISSNKNNFTSSSREAENGQDGGINVAEDILVALTCFFASRTYVCYNFFFFFSH